MFTSNYFIVYAQLGGGKSNKRLVGETKEARLCPLCGWEMKRADNVGAYICGGCGYEKPIKKCENKIGKEFNYKFVKENIGLVSQFIPEGYYKYKQTHQPVLCQIKGCEESVTWIQNLKDIAILICFNHHEQLSHERA